MKIFKKDEKFYKEIKENIHIYLDKNINYDKSFELNELYEEFKKFEFENQKIDITPHKIMNIDEKLLKHDTEKAIKSIFEFPPKKLPVYDFKKTKNFEIIENKKNKENFDNKDKDEKEKEKNEKEKSIDSFSNDSISEAFSYSSSNSERNSVNDMEGNIKKSDDNTTFVDSKIVQKDI